MVSLGSILSMVLGAAATISAPIVVAAPRLLDPASIVKFTDYPSQALRDETSGFPLVRITVSKTGGVISCVVRRPPRTDLDSLTCSLFRRRAKFAPAHASDNLPLLGVFTTRVAWTAGRYVGAPMPGSEILDVTLAKFPDGVTAPIDIDLAVAVDQTGRAGACAAADEKQSNRLVPIACSQIVQMAFEPAIDEEGNPGPSVQTAKVHFEVGPVAPPPN